MSYANGTPFLNLPQTVGTDHRDWFDENAANLNLDTKMKTLWDGAADTATILAELQETVATLDTDVSALQNTVSGHTSTIGTINESLVLINTALTTLNTQVTNKFDSAGIADPYDADHGIYAVGDVVTYNGQRYVCNTAVGAAEPFDVSKWTAEDVQTVLDNLSHDVDVVTLYDTAITTTTSQNITLSDDIDNYEYLVFKGYQLAAVPLTLMLPTKLFKAGGAFAIFHFVDTSNHLNSCLVEYVDNTTVKVSSGTTVVTIGFNGVFGVK